MKISLNNLEAVNARNSDEALSSTAFKKMRTSIDTLSQMLETKIAANVEKVNQASKLAQADTNSLLGNIDKTNSFCVMIAVAISIFILVSRITIAFRASTFCFPTSSSP